MKRVETWLFPGVLSKCNYGIKKSQASDSQPMGHNSIEDIDIYIIITVTKL